MKNFNAVIIAMVMLIMAPAYNIASENMLDSSKFSTADEWLVYIAKDSKTAGSKYKFIDGALIIYSAVTENQDPNSIQIVKKADLTAKKKYKVTIKIKSDKDGVLQFKYALYSAPYTGFAFSKIMFSATEQEYSCVLSVSSEASKNNESKCIRLVAGGLKGVQLTFSDISIEEVQ